MKINSFIFVLLLVVLVFLFHAKAAEAVVGEGLIAGGISLVLMIIATVCKLFVSLAASLLGVMLQPDLYNFTTEPVIVTGWVICRDVCNMFFLIFLLFIAFCTILQIEKYHAKKTLLMLIIMALLINFSKPIAIFIFDGAQLLMNMFLKANVNYETTVTNLARISEIVYKDLPGASALIFSSETNVSIAVRYIFAIIFLFMYAVALLVLGIYLFIRIVAMWLIIIVSPFAFLASAIPDFKKISSSWWDALFKYSYVGPAIAFFLYISTRLATTNLKTAAARIKSDGSFVSIVNIISYLVVLIFLYASIIMAEKFGIQFASAITGRANKVLSGFAGYMTGWRAARWSGIKAWEGAKYATRAGLKMAERKWLMPYGLSPRARWEGWKQRSEEIDREALDRATGASRDQYHRWLDKAHTNYEQLAIDRLKVKKMKEYSEQNEDFKFLGAQMSGLVGSSASDAKEKMSGIFRIAWKNKDQDELLWYIKNNLDTKLADGRSFKDLGFNEENTRVSGKNANDAVTRLLGSAGATDGYVNKELLDLGVIAASNGGVGFGAVKWDDKKNEFVRIERVLKPGEAPPENLGEEANYAIRKLLTSGEAQQVPKFFHRNHFTDEGDEHGENRKFNEEGKQALWLYASNVAAIEHSGRFRPDFYRQVGADTQITDQMYDYISDMYAGKAMAYDSTTKKHGKVKADPHKATLAAAWLSAVQARSGVEIGEIKENMRKVAEKNNLVFEDFWNEVKKYQKTGKIELEKPKEGGKGGGAKKSTEPEEPSPLTMEGDGD